MIKKELIKVCVKTYVCFYFFLRGPVRLLRPAPAPDCIIGPPGAPPACPGPLGPPAPGAPVPRPAMRGGVTGRPVLMPPYWYLAFFSLGLRI